VTYRGKKIVHPQQIFPRNGSLRGRDEVGVRGIGRLPLETVLLADEVGWTIGLRHWHESV
jgi:hypothetical protein